MKKFLFFLVLPTFFVSSAFSIYRNYEGCPREKRINYVEILRKPCEISERYQYHQGRCGERSSLAFSPVKTYRYAIEVKKPFYAQITSNKTIDSYANVRYGNVENVNEGEKIKFYPDFTSLTPYQNVTWKWHYDSRGLNCVESSAGTLDCVVSDKIPSEVWAEFYVPEYKNNNWGDTYQSNVIKVYPKLDQYINRYPSVIAPIAYEYTYTYPTKTYKRVYPNYKQQPFSHFYFYGY
ncbi:hypothetical protein K9L27_03400 [Candidatus Gracilibacteria bacterium]|nr:hypothetical protein [Candidatus Gracilibacteria bacterium]